MLNVVLPHCLSMIKATTFLTYSKPKHNEGAFYSLAKRCYAGFASLLDRVSTLGTSEVEKSDCVISGQLDKEKLKKIASKRKVVVALMSSYDEILAAYAICAFDTSDGKLFGSQVDWINEITNFFKKRQDLFLIIRVHPRELPNAREGQKSENAILYEKIFEVLPSNIIINWPADDISIYDLAEYADLFLNGFSSSGLEVSLLGLPVISSVAEWNSYPIDLDYKVESRAEYFSAIDTMLERGWDFERIRLSFRWLAFKFSLTTFDISDGFAMQLGDKIQKNIDLQNKPDEIMEKNNIVRFIESGSAHYVDLQDENMFAAADYAEETECVKGILKGVYEALYHGCKPGKLGKKLQKYIK
jgi:hypothetical protein